MWGILSVVGTGNREVVDVANAVTAVVATTTLMCTKIGLIVCHHADYRQ